MALMVLDTTAMKNTKEATFAQCLQTWGNVVPERIERYLTVVTLVLERDYNSSMVVWDTVCVIVTVTSIADVLFIVVCIHRLLPSACNIAKASDDAIQ